MDAGGEATCVPRVRRGYVDMRYGQLHYRCCMPEAAEGPGTGTEAGPSADEGAAPGERRVSADRTPLVYLTQTPYTSEEFGALLPEMGRDRPTYALDTPGYGSSDGPATQPSIEDYAAAIAGALRNLGYDGGRPVDLVGLHTGAFTTIELAIRHPDLVRRAVLVGVWLVDEERRRRAIANLPRYRTTDEFFDWFQAARPRLKARQLGQNLSDEQWGRVMVESLRPLTRREFGHDAAFEYGARLRERAPLVEQRVLLLALDDGIRELTLASRALFRHAQVADLPHLQDGAFFTAAPELGAVLRGFLDAA